MAAEDTLTLLRAFLRCARYGPIVCLAYLEWGSRCGDGGVLLHVPLNASKSVHAMCILRLSPHMAVDSVLASVAIRRLTKTNWGALKNQE